MKLSIETPMLENKNIQPLTFESEIAKEDPEKNMSESHLVKYERIGILIAVLAQFFWALSVIAVKLGSKCGKFSANSFSMWKSLAQMLISLYLIKKKGIQIQKFSEIKSKGWFLLRTFGNYFCYNCLILAIVYLRAATASCLAGANPFVIIILSVWLLKEKFYIRYLLGIIVCFLGSSMIVLNEKHGGSETVGKNANVPLGVFFGLCHVILVGSSIFGQKIIVSEGVLTDVQVFYTGLYNLLTALVVCVFQMNFGFNIPLIIVSALNALAFYGAIAFTDKALKRMDVVKFAPSSYIQALFVFIIGLVLFGESVYITDLIGSFLIVAFHVYNAYDPIK